MASLCSSIGVHFCWKILSLLNSKYFRLGCFVLFCAYSAVVSNRQVTSISFNFVQMRKFDRLMASNMKFDRRTCCRSPDREEDICGRPNCTSPSCPSPRVLDQLKSDGHNAFFIETSGSGGLNIRQACAVESLAFHNPNLTVNVLFTDDDGHRKPINKHKMVNKTVEKFKSKYGNVQFIVVDLDEYVAGTSMEKWFHCNDWRTGPYHVAHLSDGLRFLTLHKYGGYYFDLDVIFVRPVTYYRNFITAASATNFANGILHADYGHPITQLAVNDFPSHYDKNKWRHNGPDLVMRIMKIHCGEENFSAINDVSCRGFSVLPRSTFLPIHWSNWQSFFTQRPANETGAPSWITNQVVGVHVWNKLSWNETAYKNSTQEYVRLVRPNCPEIFSMAPETF